MINTQNALNPFQLESTKLSLMSSLEVFVCERVWQLICESEQKTTGREGRVRVVEFNRYICMKPKVETVLTAIIFE